MLAVLERCNDARFEESTPYNTNCKDAELYTTYRPVRCISFNRMASFAILIHAYVRSWSSRKNPKKTGKRLIASAASCCRSHRWYSSHGA
ncbi:hypothetical protein MPTK1_5g10420 [Marchantia polymorpha subsp. ruderalis]|uniref:Uncharacterized protein n=2 Tax=Marchantia polymorpha TaxID=3197 RepID=A0AAF6BGX9_MARPO|nr:hypothetical protein MARPO_0048s0030 [Marchantia polymorpha]BBN11263.1 hypothetical protein Mp_5g10420 [Marchantia polymorpha subsp. ruderalis]|eukprot:PTQ38907.1 hypothetical protein MARPO_0048s0030 [Marchantia polymorpha]